MAVSEYLGMMPATVTVEPFSSRDAYGAATYGLARSHRARIEMGNRLVTTASGEEKVARGRVFLATTAPPSASDRLTLPAPYEPSRPPILDVRPVEDERGIHHVVLLIG